MKTLLLSCQWVLVIALIGPLGYAQAQIAFSIDKDSLATEPAKGSNIYPIRVKASATPTSPTQVTITDQLTGDASPTQDYSFRPNPTVLTFGPGLQQTQLVAIEIYADSKVEENETIHLKLSVPAGYTVTAANSYTVNITDANQETPPLSPFRIATGTNFDFLNNAAELKNLFFGFEIFAPTAFSKKNNWALTGFNIGFAWSQNFSADSNGVRFTQNEAIGRIGTDCTLVRRSNYFGTSTTQINNFNFFASHLARISINDAGTLETYFAIRFEGIRRNFITKFSYELDSSYQTRSAIPIARYPRFIDLTKTATRTDSYYDFYLSVGFPFKWEPQSEAVEFRFNPMVGVGWFTSPYHQSNRSEVVRIGQQAEFDRFFYGAQLSVIEKKFGIRIGGEVRGSFGTNAPYYTVTLSKVFTFRKFEDYITLKK